MSSNAAPLRPSGDYAHGCDYMSDRVGTFLLLGASGDLSHRLLMPALAELFDREPQRRDIVLVGAGTEAWTNAQWRERVQSSLSTVSADAATCQAVLSRHVTSRLT